MQLPKTSRLIIYALLVISAYLSARYVQKNGDVDLRTRIVGSRLLYSNQSPYFYKWKAGDNERWFDIDLSAHPNLKTNRLTVAPSILLLNYPLSHFSHTSIKWIWFLCSWLAIIASLLLLYKAETTGVSKNALLLTAFAFICSASWIFHLERGQTYIIYTFLLSAAWYLYCRKYFFWCGAALAVLMWLRLPFIIIIPFLFLLPYKKIILGLITCIAILLLISFICIPTAVWIDYFEAMNIWSTYQIKALSVPQHITELPTIIEGQENVGKMTQFMVNNGSLQAFLYSKGITILTVQLGILFTVFMSSILIILFRQKNWSSFSPKEVFLLISIVIVILEYFLPAPRLNYNYLLLLFPVFLLINTTSFLNQTTVLVFLITGLLLNLGVLSFAGYSLILGELFILLSIFVYLFTTRAETN